MIHKNFTDIIENKKSYIGDDFYKERNINNKNTYDTENKLKRNNELLNNYSCELKKKIKDNSLNHYSSEHILSMLNSNNDARERHMKFLKDSRNSSKKFSQKEIEELKYKYKSNDYYGMPYNNIYEKRNTYGNIRNKYSSLNFNRFLITNNDNKSLYSHNAISDKSKIDGYNDSPLLRSRDFNNLNDHNFKIFNYERKKNANRINENLDYCKKIINNEYNDLTENFSPRNEDYDKYKMHYYKPMSNEYDLESSSNYRKFLSENCSSNNYKKNLGNKNTLEEKEEEDEKEKKKYAQDKKILYETFFNITEKLEKIKNTKVNKHKRNQGLEEERNGYYSNSMDNITKESIHRENSLSSNFYNRKKYNTSAYTKEIEKEYDDLSDLKNYIKKFSPSKNTVSVNSENKEKLYKRVKSYEDILKHNSIDSLCSMKDKSISKKERRENFDNDLLIKEKLWDHKLNNSKKKNLNLDNFSLTSNNLRSTQLHVSALSHGSNDYSTLYDYVNYSKNQTKDYYNDENMYKLSKSSYATKNFNKKDIEKIPFLHNTHSEIYKNNMNENNYFQSDRLEDMLLENNDQLKSYLYTPNNINISIKNNSNSYQDPLMDNANNKVDGHSYNLNNNRNIKNSHSAKHSLILNDNYKEGTINNLLDYEENKNNNENENDNENENLIENIGKKYIFKDDEKLDTIFNLRKQKKINKNNINVDEEKEEKYNLKKKYENEININNKGCNFSYHNTNNTITDFCNYLRNRSYTRPMNVDDLNLDDEDDNSIKMNCNINKNNSLNYNDIFIFILIHFLKLLYFLFKYLIHVILFLSIHFYNFLKKKSLKTVIVSILIGVPFILFVLSVMIFSYRSMNVEYFDKDI